MPSLFTPNAVGGSGRWLLSFPSVTGCWFHSNPASLPQIHQVEGTSQVSFPHQGRYSPATRPDTLENDGDNGDVDGAKDGTSSDRCSSGSGAVWVFCLASGGFSGVIWTSFERKVFLRDAPGLPLAPSWGLGASGPCVGAAGGLRFSLS
jgi:hypothetical protein